MFQNWCSTLRVSNLNVSNWPAPILWVHLRDLTQKKLLKTKKKIILGHQGLFILVYLIKINKSYVFTKIVTWIKINNIKLAWIGLLNNWSNHAYSKMLLNFSLGGSRQWIHTQRWRQNLLCHQAWHWRPFHLLANPSAGKQVQLRDQCKQCGLPLQCCCLLRTAAWLQCGTATRSWPR